jgi:prevent-host-death family protein
MRTLTAKDAKYGFGQLIDLARAEPLVVAKHGRPVVVVMAVEEFERLKQIEIDFKKSGSYQRLISEN